ncbi:hypothetical protein J6590_042277 [Homalodisca vitripennis]|nr:hypothetical protein J6590_042277 [Homalodisca vitripennis]
MVFLSFECRNIAICDPALYARNARIAIRDFCSFNVTFDEGFVAFCVDSDFYGGFKVTASVEFRIDRYADEPAHVLFALGDQDTNDQYSDSESDLDVFEDSSSDLDDTDADIDYYPSSDDESDLSNTNVGLMFTSTPKKPNKRTLPELQGNQKRLKLGVGLQQRSPVYSDHSSPDIDDSDMTVTMSRRLKCLLTSGYSTPPPSDWIEVGPDEDFPLIPIGYNELPGPKHMLHPESSPVIFIYFLLNYCLVV